MKDLNQQKTELMFQKSEIDVVNDNHSQDLAFGCSLINRLDYYYEQASLDLKQKLLEKVFGRNLIFNGESFLTKKENEVFRLIRDVKRDCEGAKKKRTVKNNSTPTLARPGGFEPP